MEMVGRRLIAATAAALSLVAAAPARAVERARPTGRWLVVFEKTSSVRSAGTLSTVLRRAPAARRPCDPQLGVVTVRGSEAAIRARAVIRG